MRVGLVARAEDRGLGILSWEIHRHLDVEPLVVDMGELARGFPPHLERYPDAPVVGFDGAAFSDEALVRDWLAGLDVVLMLETAYDQRFIGWARAAGVRTVLMTMPEFWRGDLTEQPDAVWNPTSWRHDTLPGHARVVPVPVATDRFETQQGRTEGPIRVLHNAGHRAAMDRNGTIQFLTSLRLIVPGVPVEVTVSGQDGRLPAPRVSSDVAYTARPNGSGNYWEVPVGFDLLVMPRRYGGLCLPVQEAMAAGVVPVMPACLPNTDWPVVPLPWKPHGEIRTPGGTLPLALTAPLDIARAVTGLVLDPELLSDHRARVLAWAAYHSWANLAPLWMDELEMAARPA